MFTHYTLSIDLLTGKRVSSYPNNTKMKESLENLSRLENSYRVMYLLREYLKKNLSIEEEEELDKWLLQRDDHMKLFEELTNEDNLDDFLKWYGSRDVEKNLSQVKKRLKFRRTSRVISLWKYAAAACILGLIGFSVYYLIDGKKTQKSDLAVSKLDIPPGTNDALLKLGNGEMIFLRGIHDTVINDQVKVVNGELVYAPGERNSVQMHELDIPRKGFYNLILPDGTRAWLNSESTIRYPSEFDSIIRRVTITGECYFEVAHNPYKPFIVSVNGIDIQALGTEFDINAYPNEEAFLTTLVHGLVKVSSGDKQVTLKPGQQIKIRNNNWALAQVETESITAWKDNKFKFKNAPIEEIMRQVERWYDVKIKYADKILFHFNGTIDRNVPVSHLLHLLEETGNVAFEIKDGEIVVKK